ncbi:glycosyltransferase [Candidatus Uhrbacteria bacterium]|nr:glycosyltransferase [Candidatus Uhrbacteria bacterium]
MNRPCVTAIIPAFNEEQTIENVIRPLVASPLVDEVFVISDGSTDNTKEVAEKAGAKVLKIQRTGKGGAMMYAVAQTNSPIIAFFDADLVGLTEEHVETLLVPVINGGLMMNVGIRDRGIFWTAISRHLPLISGERAMNRRVFESVPPEFIHGFMVESALNYFCKLHKWRFGSVVMHGLTFRRKYKKVPIPLAVVQYISMFWQVGIAMLTVRLAKLFGRNK